MTYTDPGAPRPVLLPLIACMAILAAGGYWVDGTRGAVIGALIPPGLGFLAIAVWALNDVTTHWQHGSGTNPDGSIKWRGES